MKLENQVVSLKLAQQLKELGVPQESLWWWVDFENSSCIDHDSNNEYKTMRFQSIEDEQEIEEMKERGHINILGVYSAFTVAELGEMLPKEPTYLTIFEAKDTKKVRFCAWPGSSNAFDQMIIGNNDSDTEANARAKALIWLIENDLLNPKDL